VFYVVVFHASSQKTLSWAVFAPFAFSAVMVPRQLPCAAQCICVHPRSSAVDFGLTTRTLAALRDALLPKLMSGEIRVKAEQNSQTI